MNTHQFDTVAWVSSPHGLTLIPVTVMYEHNGGRPYVYRVTERDDQEADITASISDAECDLIYSKVMTDLRAKQVEYAEVLLEGER